MPVQNRIPFFMSPGKCDGNDLAADIQWLFPPGYSASSTWKRLGSGALTLALIFRKRLARITRAELQLLLFSHHWESISSTLKEKGALDLAWTLLFSPLLTRHETTSRACIAK